MLPPHRPFRDRPSPKAIVKKKAMPAGKPSVADLIEGKHETSPPARRLRPDLVVLSGGNQSLGNRRQ